MADKKKLAAEAKDKGNKFFVGKQYDQAIEWYTKAIQYDPNDSAFYSNRCAAYMGLNKFEEALADAEKCCTLQPKWVKGYYRKGAALMSLSRYEEAARAFRKGLECEPNNDDLKEKLAEAEREAKYTAKRFDENGQPLSPAQIAKEEGNVMFRESKYEKAIEKYTRAIQLAATEEEKAVYYSNRATCHAQLQDHQAVVADCTASIIIKPTTKALIRRGLAYESLEKYKLALADMRQVLELDPSARVASETITRLTRAINSM
jgi:stress-induced-phosphoprotein 1